MNYFVLSGILFVIVGFVQLGIGIADIVKHRKEITIHHWKTRTVNEKGELLKEEIYSYKKGGP
jgi:hypothetical protein